MVKPNVRDEQSPSHPDDLRAADRDERRRGGQELPDDVQDRPEQNAGYDAAVRHGQPEPVRADAEIDTLPGDGAAGLTVHEADGAEANADDIDARAERDVVAEVRRRERRAR